jgi:hypothetical protein
VYNVALDGFGTAVAPIGMERLAQHARVEEAIYAKKEGKISL